MLPEGRRAWTLHHRKFSQHKLDSLITSGSSFYSSAPRSPGWFSSWRPVPRTQSAWFLPSDTCPHPLHPSKQGSELLDEGKGLNLHHPIRSDYWALETGLMLTEELNLNFVWVNLNVNSYRWLGSCSVWCSPSVPHIVENCDLIYPAPFACSHQNDLWVLHTHESFLQIWHWIVYAIL